LKGAKMIDFVILFANSPSSH